MHISWDDGINLCMRLASERWCYSLTPSLIGWADTPCNILANVQTSKRAALQNHLLIVVQTLDLVFHKKKNLEH